MMRRHARQASGGVKGLLGAVISAPAKFLSGLGSMFSYDQSSPPTWGDVLGYETARHSTIAPPAAGQSIIRSSALGHPMTWGSTLHHLQEQTMHAKFLSGAQLGVPIAEYPIGPVLTTQLPTRPPPPGYRFTSCPPGAVCAPWPTTTVARNVPLPSFPNLHGSGLGGIMDTITGNPLLLIGGLGIGVYLASRALGGKKKRR